MATSTIDSDATEVSEKATADARKLRKSPAVDIMREAFLKNSISATRLGGVFRRLDDNGNQRINFREFQDGLRELHVRVGYNDMLDTFHLLDADKSGTIDFDEFVTAMRPAMPHHRLALVDQAFKKLDITGDGIVTIEDIKMIYNTEDLDDPHLNSFEWKGAAGLNSLVKYFTRPVGKNKQVVTRQAFMDYYSGISCSMKDDEQFRKMIQYAWKLTPAKMK